MHRQITNVKKTTTTAAVALPLFGTAPLAGAQTIDQIGINSLTRAALERDDLSIGLLEGILGEFVRNPFTQVSAPDGLIGHIFLVVNLLVFSLGALALGYFLIAGTLQTAHEGVVLGKRMSAVWMPIRVTIGVVGMMPIFGGFSIMQAIMMFFVVIGVGAGNFATDFAIRSVEQFQPMVRSAAVVSPEGGQNALAVPTANALFFSAICALEDRRFHNGGSAAPVALFVDQLDQQDGSLMAAGAFCGGVRISSDPRQARDGDSVVGFRVASIDYPAAAGHGRRLVNEQLRALAGQVERVARLWHSQLHDYGRADHLGWPTEQLDAARLAARVAADASVRDQMVGAQGALTAAAVENIRAGGWAGLGSWYATIAEANAALADAARATEVTLILPGDAAGTPLSEGLRAFRAPPRRAEGLVLVDPVVEALRIAALQREVAAEPVDCPWLTRATATGDCSAGQAVAGWLIDRSFENSGGAGLVNPVIASKNLGDWLMVASQSAFAGGSLASLIPVSRAVGRAGAAWEKIKSAVGRSTEKSMPIIKPFLVVLFIVGALLSLYIPMIPFLTWFSGLVAWATAVFEGLIAAQLWAMNHITTDGEGLGPRTERGYGYLLNMVLRPLLMVLAFFLASGLVVGLGTLFLQLFGTAVANIQGNSATGLASIVGLVVIFAISVVVLVQSIFNLIHELPDRVLGWIGTGLDARFGRDLDHEIKQTATTAIRWSGTVVR